MENKFNTETKEKLSDEKRIDLFRQLDTAELNHLYFGLMQIKNGVEFIDEALYVFPCEYIEDSWLIARDRLERFLSSFFDSSICEETFEIVAINEAGRHVENIWCETGKHEIVLNLLKEMRNKVILEKHNNIK